MPRRTSWVVLLFVGLITNSCGPGAPSGDPVADAAAIDAVREREIAAFSAGQLDSLAAVQTADVVLMPPNEPAVSSSDAVRTWAQNIYNQFTVTGRYTEDEATVAGDWAIERYAGELTLTPKAGGASITERIKGIHVYRRQPDGSWRIAQDVWNTDAPPPAPAAAGTSK